MVSLKKYNKDGNEIGQISIDEEFINVDANRQMIKDYLVALRRNERQWSANTKGRSEVVHTTKKPYKQKGTGNARQGMLVTSQYKGGGIVFGPKPKFDQHVRINRKERRLAIRHLLAEKIRDNGIVVVEDVVFGADFKEPKTKNVCLFLDKLSLKGKRLLFVGEHVKDVVAEDPHANFKSSMRNLKRCSFARAANVNGYDVVLAQGIVVTESALAEWQNMLMA